MLILSTTLEGMSSRADKSWKLTFGTLELTPQQLSELGKIQQSICLLGISSDPFTSEEKEIIENTKVELAETGKSHSQRLRGVLYVNWQTDNESYENFHDYYIVKMDKIINHFKSKLP